MAADQRRFEHGRGKRVFGELRQEGEARGPLAAGPLGEVAPVEQHAARGRGAQAGERVQRQRLADAVSAQHRDELAALGGELESAYQRAPGDLDVDGAAGERGRGAGAQGCRRS